VVTLAEKNIPTFKRIYQARDGQTVEEAGEGLTLERLDGAAVQA
jgi:putative ABC transport system ATP-binding protein